MDISENLKRAVAEKNLADVRGALWSCLMMDANMTGLFKQSLEYVLSNGILEAELYEDDDGKSFGEEATAANFDELAGRIRVNFSKRKLDALKRIGRVLSPEQATRRPSGHVQAGDPRSGRCRPHGGDPKPGRAPAGTGGASQSPRPRQLPSQPSTRYTNSSEVPDERGDDVFSALSRIRERASHAVRRGVAFVGRVVVHVGELMKSWGEEN